MEKEKKLYVAPKATKVKLVAREAVLGGCHASPVLTPRRATACQFQDECWSWSPPVAG